MRILWVCNNVLPDFCQEFELKWNFGAGWVTGLLHAFQYCSEYEIGLCFPIIDEYRMRSATFQGHKYYSFHMDMNYRTYADDMKNEFVPIVQDFVPDVVHIWGTERNHAKAALDACIACGISNKIVVHIQGIAAMMGLHYAVGLADCVITKKNDAGIAEIEEERNQFYRWGITERYVLENTKFVTGRTEWDAAYVKRINSQARYIACEEILRDRFYQCRQTWQPCRCHRHTIFVSQAHYPLKGLHFLLSAMLIIIERYPHAEVHIGGHNPLNPDKNGKVSIYGQFLQKLISEYGLDKTVKFLGILQEEAMIDEYLNANVYVLPSTIDNSPNSIAEAMLLGTPIVASYVGGVPSIIAHGDTGLLYPCDEHYMLAHYIMRIFEDDVLAEHISRNGRRKAAMLHNPHTICDCMKEVYKEIGDGCELSGNSNQ